MADLDRFSVLSLTCGFLSGDIVGTDDNLFGNHTYPYY